MRKFLDFVARDDRPILTPPSESESGYDQLAVDGFTNGNEEDVPVEPDTKDELNDLKHELVRAVSITDNAPSSVSPSRETSHHTDLHEFHPDTSNSVGYESSESFTNSPSLTPLQTIRPTNGTTDSVTGTDGHENVRHKVIAAEPGLMAGRSQVRKQAAMNVRKTVAERSKLSGSRPRVREVLSRSDDRLRSAARILSSFASHDVREVRKSREDEGLRETQAVVGALREIAETMVWADQHEPRLWDTFMECSIMYLLLCCLGATETSTMGVEKRSGDDAEVTAELETSQGDGKRSTDRTGESTTSISSLSTGDAVDGARYEPAREVTTEVNVTNIRDQSCEQIALEIQSQVLQTLSIMIQSIFRQHSLLCLFSCNHINEILSFGFRFEDDEMLGYFMSAVKTIALKLDRALLQLFFDPEERSFPLYTRVVRFYDHREQMVRIAVRNVTLTIYALGDPEVLTFAAHDESVYLYKTVDLLVKLCGSVARGFELLLDDGREVRRTRSRTGLFRKKVRESEVAGKLEEVENLFAYLGDVSSISKDTLRPLVARLLSTKLVSPLFRPIASRASPKAIELQKKWRLTTTMASNSGTPALPVFDAAARCLLLACVLENCRSSCLGEELMGELSHCTSEFEGRSVLHALKAMASDITGTEKASFVSLCAIEAFILCDATTREAMRSLKYDFSRPAPVESFTAIESFKVPFADGEDQLEGEHRKSQDQPLLMTLSAFDAPLTPSNSLPSTPKYVPPSPSDSATPPKGLSRVASATSFSTDGLTFPESSNDPDEVLTTFQRGEASLRETVSSLVLVVRRREVRTLRIMHAICRILNAVGSKTSNQKLCVEVSKSILDEIAAVMRSFLGNKRTTIVSIEKMFENFRSAAKEDASKYTTVLSLDNILSPDCVPKIAGGCPKGVGKRRRVLNDDATPPTETEDALILFVMLHAYETAIDNLNKADVLPELQLSQSSESRLSTAVREILLKCSLDESYLDKREALRDVADTVLRHSTTDMGT